MTQIKRIRLKEIVPNPNLRVPSDLAIQSMAESFAEIGQLSPVGAIETDDIKLIYGNTRFLAAMQLDWEFIEVKLYPRDTKPEDCLRISISENSVREQMSFVESYDAIHEYANLRGLPVDIAGLTQAGKELNYKPSQVSKCIGTNERLSSKNKMKLLEAGIAPSLAYLVSREDTKFQDQLVDAVINDNWSRKQLEQHFRDKKKGGTKFEYRKNHSKVQVEVPRSSTQDDVFQLIKAFVSELKKCNGLNLATAARVIRELAHV